MKLIRDNTPDLLRGSTRPVRDDEEKDILLRSKLMEEAAEVAASTSKEELLAEFGDLWEVMNTMLNLHGLTADDVIAAAEEKYQQKGGFEKGLLLTYDPLSNKIPTPR